MLLRRRAALAMGALLAAIPMLSQPVPAAAAEPVRSMSGANLADWKLVLGDSLSAPKGVAAVTLADVGLTSTASSSTLSANVGSRPVMAHAIAYTPVNSADQLLNSHRAAVTLQLPAVPSRALAGQTVEVGLFVWDGANTRKDYGVAVQWVVSPWDARYGELRTWSSNGWVSAGRLKPDAAPHRFEVATDIARRWAQVIVDGSVVPAGFATTAKPDGWGTTVSARFQVEAVSLWPNAKAKSALEHDVVARDWTWRQAPSAPMLRRGTIRWS